MGTDVLQSEVGHVLTFLREYRENGISSAQTYARDIAEEMEIPMVFPTQRGQKPKRQFPYESQNADSSLTMTPEERFKRDVFLPLVDSAIMGTSVRFKLMESFHSLFGFIYGRKEMKRAVEAGALQKSCKNMEETLGNVDAEELVREVSSAVTAVPEQENTGQQMLSYIYTNNLLDLYPNLSIALRLMLTVPVTVASKRGLSLA